MRYTQPGSDPSGDAPSVSPGIGERYGALASKIIDRTRRARRGPDAFELMAIARVKISPRILGYAIAREPFDANSANDGRQ